MGQFFQRYQENTQLDFWHPTGYHYARILDRKKFIEDSDYLGSGKSPDFKFCERSSNIIEVL